MVGTIVLSKYIAHHWQVNVILDPFKVGKVCTKHMLAKELWTASYTLPLQMVSRDHFVLNDSHYAPNMIGLMSCE